MKKQKHILFISSWYPNRNNLTHGIFNEYLAKAAALYNKVSVIHVCSDQQITQSFEIVKGKNESITTVVVYYKKVTKTLPFFSQLKKRKRFLQAYDLGYKELISEQGQPQLIQLNVAMMAGIGVLYLSNKYNIPFVVNENWSGYTKEDGNYKGFIQKYYTKKIIKQAKKIMPTSKYLMEAMLDQGLTGDYEVVPNVVDVNKFIPLQVTETKKIKFIHISSLIEREKNVSGILRGFQKALEVNPDLELVIVGEGEYKNELQRLSEKLKIASKVDFKGRLTGMDLINTINQCQALVMFSHYETFCLVIIEAFACGKPVITSNAGAIPSYMNEKLGMLVEKGDEKSLTSSILKFATNPAFYDAKYIRNFSLNYSYEKIGAQLDEIYNKVIST